MALRMGKYGSSGTNVGGGRVKIWGLSSLGIEAQMGGSAIGRTAVHRNRRCQSGGEGLTKFKSTAVRVVKNLKSRNTDSPDI